MAKVVKFGGSSLADANQFRKVAEIIRSDKERRYVVPSAPGKRFSDDTKVTDMLSSSIPPDSGALQRHHRGSRSHDLAGQGI